MRTVLFLRAAATIAAAVSLAGAAVAVDPCPTCANGSARTLTPKPKCDSHIYPLSEWHYIHRYCGPVISPNATYGFHATQWRAWDGATGPAGCAAHALAPAGVTTTLPDPVAETPKPATTDARAMPKVPAPAVPGKEAIPAPAPKPLDKGKSLSLRVGALPPSTLLSPGVSLVPANQ